MQLIIISLMNSQFHIIIYLEKQLLDLKKGMIQRMTTRQKILKIAQKQVGIIGILSI